MSSKGPQGRVPLERALSKLGLASRTQARKWILEGRMRVNGVVRRDPLFPVTPETARFEVDGKPMAGAAERRVLMLHKPSGVVTTRSDEKGRPTVFSLLEGMDLYLHAVGRLDQATSGLLLITNDTRLSSWLTDPANAVPRVYLVTVRGLVEEAQARALEQGGVAAPGEDGRPEILRAQRVEIRKASRRETHLTVTLGEGKNREVRRMFETLGNPVTRLKRVAFGPLELGDLAPGKYRDLGAAELSWISCASAAPAPASPAR